MLSVPALRARRYEQTRATEELLAPVLAARMGAGAGDLEVRAVTAAILGAVVAAVEHWAAEGGELPALIDRHWPRSRSGSAPAGAGNRGKRQRRLM